MTPPSPRTDPRNGTGSMARELEPENRALRERLDAVESRFRSIVERSVDGVIVLSPEGRIRFANPSIHRLLGRDEGDLVGNEFGFPAVAGERTEIDLVRPDGTILIAEMRVAETTWDGEDALLVLIRDVTDRKAAEERERELIREQAARAKAEAEAHRVEVLNRATDALGSTLDLEMMLRALAEVLVDEIADVCLIEIDDQHGPLRRLAAARRGHPRPTVLKGIEERPARLRADSLEARVFRTGEAELVPEVSSEWLEAAGADAEWIQLCHTLEPASLMMVTLRAGTLPWGVVTLFSCEPDRRYGPSDLALASEIIRRSGIAIENARLMRLAQEASRAKSEFLAVISHELRTPLSAIIGYAGLLQEQFHGPIAPEQEEYVASIQRSASHLIRLIDQLMVYARLDTDRERVDVEEVDAAEVAHDVVTLAKHLAERKRLELVEDLPPDGAPVVTDGKKLSQILINLVTNAIKYTDEGEVRVEMEQRNTEIEFRVRDTGIGIDASELDEIFEPFRQLEGAVTRSEGGTGIGLSVVRDLTHLLGGEVGVESKPGDGSTFSVRLPRTHSGSASR